MNDTSLAAHDAYVGTLLGGRYRVVALLGSGGMGAVYRAEHVHMKKPVAVKILHRHMMTNAEVVARFEREAVAAGRIVHPNVAAATDFGKLEDGSFYLVLEYVEGRSLARVIAGRPLELRRALGIARQIAAGLAAAHEAGVVHRDLKPDNVLLVERDDAHETVKVLDFGIAKVHLGEGSGREPLTQMGTIFGTPQYMSPEQGQGRPVDARSDLYSLGVILYEMLVGKLPFHADDLVVLITRHVTEPPPPLPAEVPAPVRELVENLLEKRPEARVSSASLLGERLDELLASDHGTERLPASARGSAESPLAAARARVEPALNAARARVEPALVAAGRGARGVVVAGLLRLHRAIVARVPSLDRSVRIGPITLPLLGALASGLGLALCGALLTLVVAPRPQPRRTPVSDSAEGAASAAPSRQAEAERHRALIARATAGDAAALAALEAIPEAQREPDEARALGHGRCATGAFAACIAAYKAAVLAFPTLGREPGLLADVHRVAMEPAAYEDAMRLAALQLGDAGLDLLWDVYQSTSGESQLAAVNRRARQFLDDSAVREHATRELALVFDLEHAEKYRRCGEAKALLPRVLDYGDARLVTMLDRLKTRRGCGFIGLGDCWSCLRGGQDLARAREAAGARKAPSFAGAERDRAGSAP